MSLWSLEMTSSVSGEALGKSRTSLYQLWDSPGLLRGVDHSSLSFLVLLVLLLPPPGLFLPPAALLVPPAVCLTQYSVWKSSNCRARVAFSSANPRKIEEVSTYLYL